ncbi:MAG: formyltransferase family protein [Candidatus Bathyarchaeota archaeon]|nr:formyltransferase family protein [Candidatus Bathyarchaeota archaeon]
MSDKQFVFMVLDEHPYGREMLMKLMEAGHIPMAIIEEASPIAEEERGKFLERIKGHRVAPTFDELLEGRDIPRYKVPHHNKKQCRLLLEELKPDLGVLGGTRIIRKRILSIPPDGMLNSHPGLLPEVRGSASPAWSVYYDIPIGSTCHFINPNIDTGDIVLKREIPIHKGDTYEKLCWLTLVMAGTLMTEAVGFWKKDMVPRTPQGKSELPTFKVPSDEVMEEVHRKLREGTYKHYED